MTCFKQPNTFMAHAFKRRRGGPGLPYPYPPLFILQLLFVGLSAAAVMLAFPRPSWADSMMVLLSHQRTISACIRFHTSTTLSPALAGTLSTARQFQIVLGARLTRPGRFDPLRVAGQAIGCQRRGWHSLRPAHSRYWPGSPVCKVGQPLAHGCPACHSWRSPTFDPLTPSPCGPSHPAGAP